MIEFFDEELEILKKKIAERLATIWWITIWSFSASQGEKSKAPAPGKDVDPVLPTPPLFGVRTDLSVHRRRSPRGRIP